MNDKQYDNNMSGALFKNKKKTTEKHPDYTGTITIDGVEYWQSAWVRTKKDGNGDKFMSQRFTRKDGEYTKTQAVSDPVLSDDDIPF